MLIFKLTLTEYLLIILEMEFICAIWILSKSDGAEFASNSHNFFLLIMICIIKYVRMPSFIMAFGAADLMYRSASRCQLQPIWLRVNIF